MRPTCTAENPFMAVVDSWVFRVDVQVDRVQFAMAEDNGSVHYMRLDMDQAQALKHYLFDFLPVHKGDECV